MSEEMHLMKGELQQCENMLQTHSVKTIKGDCLLIRIQEALVIIIHMSQLKAELNTYVLFRTVRRVYAAFKDMCVQAQ